MRCSVSVFPFPVDIRVSRHLCGTNFGVLWIREVVMAKIIEFYVPERFRKKTWWIPTDRRGKVIFFIAPAKESA